MPLKEFSPTEQSIIKNMMLSKSHRDIAALLGCDSSDVANTVDWLTFETNVVTHQMKLNQRAQQRPKPVNKVNPNYVKPVTKVNPPKQKVPPPPTKAFLEKQRKQTEKLQRIQRENEVQQERKSRRREPEFPTKAIDYSELRTVRIDARTFIYVKPGEEAKEINKFHKHHKKLIRDE